MFLFPSRTDVWRNAPFSFHHPATSESVFHAALDYLQKECSVQSIVYRAIPHIYHRYPAEEDLYVLTRLGAALVARSISSVIPLDDRLPFRTLRRRQLKKALASSLTIAEDEDFASFWPILEENLHERYGVSPVHSLEEITRLHSHFPRQISLFRVCDEAETLGGCIVYETDEVAHVQYIAASPRGKKCGALDLLFHQLNIRPLCAEAILRLWHIYRTRRTNVERGITLPKRRFRCKSNYV